MGSAPSRPLYGSAHAPLVGDAARAAQVIGTYALDAELEESCCCNWTSSPICCCHHRGEFRVPWPCNCCGADCCCCPHSPRGAAWAAASAGVFPSLLAEGGQLAVSIARAPRAPGPQLVAVGLERSEAFAQRWTPRANAMLAPYGLHCAVFHWVEDRRDDKGNKTGEVLKCAVQFYEGQRLSVSEGPPAPSGEGGASYQNVSSYYPPPSSIGAYSGNDAPGKGFFSGAPKQV